MKNLSWQLKKPLDAVVFDCDGTLSRLEGIDEVARENGVGEAVSRLTDQAMGTTGITLSLYSQRLSLVKPNRKQVLTLGQRYFDARTPDSLEVIRILNHLNKSVYVMSAGLEPAVVAFADLLDIPAQHVFSVSIQFDDHGNYFSFDETSPLADTNGKQRLMTQLKKQHPSILHVGDGANDIDVKGVVTRLVGYGGIVFRKRVQAASDFYIESLSLSPLLALALTEEESKNLSEKDRIYYDKGLKLWQSQNGGQ